MWEQIRVNKRNSVILLGLMGVVLCGLGFVLGFAFGGDQILLTSSKAVPLAPDVHPF